MEIWFDNEKPALIYFISCFFFFKEPFLVKPIPTEIQPIPDRIYKPKKKYTRFIAVIRFVNSFFS